MALPNLPLIEALRQTATNLQNGATYAWGNHGSCNCGNLMQVVGGYTRQEVLAYAHQGIGEWTELATAYCGVTDTPIDMMFAKLQNMGLTPSDIHNLEYLDNKDVLHLLPGGFKWLQRNNREDVIAYFNTYANLLEQQLLSSLNIDSLFVPEAKAVASLVV